MYCKSIAVVAAVAVLVGLAAVDSPDDERKPKLHPSSDPHAIITAAFFESGYAAQDAADLATRAIMKIKGLEVDPVDISPSRKTNLIPLHPDSDPHAILVTEYLESGWSAEEAVQHTNQHFLSLLGIEPGEWDLQPLGVDCIVYPARIITCDEEGDPMIRSGYFPTNCWNNLTGPCPTPQCDPLTEVLWYTLSISGIGCAQVFVSDTSMDVPCSHTDIIKCSRIEQSDCNQMKPQCCPVSQCAQ